MAGGNPVEQAVPPAATDPPGEPRAGRRRRLEWLPIPILLAAIVVLWVANVRVAWPQPILYWLIHYGSAAIAVGLIVIPAARSFLGNGRPSLLMLSCGILLSEIGVLAMVIGARRSLSVGFAIYNTSALLSALCHLVGVSIASRRQAPLTRRGAWLGGVFAGGAAAMALVVWLALTDRMPVFFIEGQGGTLVRTVVIVAAVALYLATAALLWRANRRAASTFVRRYALGLVLLGGGLAGSIVVPLLDSPLQWVTRSTQFLGMVYMCVAALTAARAGRAREGPLSAVEESWRQGGLLAGLSRPSPLGWALRYGLAIAAVAAAMGVRAAAAAWARSEPPPYITFYPAVMMVALLAGLGAGLAATALACLAAAWWILPPVGRLAVASPADRLGLVIFAGMGVFMSGVAEVYRRSRAKAAAFDRTAALRQSEESLRRTAEDLKRSNEDLQQFAYVASHDLQEPLRMVSGYMKLLEERYKTQLDDKGRQYIGFAVDGATRMSQLITDLLAYSRVERQGKPLEPVEVGKALDAALANLRGSVAEAGASVTHDDLPTVQADPTQLAQLFQNLVGNAVKFRSPGRPCQVHVGAETKDGHWVFSVRDNGIGIDPRHHDQVFVIFQRLHTRTQYPGTGIGLAICKKIVERHGGRIWVESTPGEGSTFHFTIPSNG